jgi:hypothetical protein
MICLLGAARTPRTLSETWEHGLTLLVYQYSVSGALLENSIPRAGSDVLRNRETRRSAIDRGGMSISTSSLLTGGP